MKLGLLSCPAVLAAFSAMVGAEAFSQSAAPVLRSIPPELEIELFAREPLVRNPCAIAFDTLGRLFVGQGPQYRSHKCDTPGDSTVILIDTDDDGVADGAKKFTSGLNCIQGLAWHGRTLWVGYSPDLTTVRDLDGDDVADEYITRPDETLPYFPQPDEIRSVTLFNEKRNFSGRVSYHLYRWGDGDARQCASNGNWFEPQKRVDAQLRYRPNSHYAVRLAARNRTQEQEYYACGRGGPLRETDLIGRNFTFGVNVNY